MKVYVLPADTHGCGHYRLIWPAFVCRRDLGIDVQIVPPSDTGEQSGFLAKFRKGEDGIKHLNSVSVPEDMDVLCIQRPAHQYQPEMIRLLRMHGVAVVVDMDDDMNNIHHKNVAYQTYNPRSDSPFSWKFAADSCRQATYVITTTKLLQKVYASHGRGQVIDNYVPDATLRFEKPATGAFGWAGMTASHPDDLQVCGSAVRDLVAGGGQFRVIGGKGAHKFVKTDKGYQLAGMPCTVKRDLRLQSEPHYTGTIGLDKWVQTIGETIDVGMVPLNPGPFNNAKSRLKGIEYMAAGVAWVASPRDEYRKLQKESGCGLLAEGGRDWYNSLNRLLTDDVLRTEQVEQGKAYMEEQTYEKQAWRWAEAWTEALKIQRGGA